ncbi:EF-hand calcium-binding domain-containing protein 6 [Microcaecilia unicolor]|uniref:EF-hand calcium-binding domain-containing protein 6 n=1 Tax=Microcaecilia unicolor TaxID=1415580 RepID=A0A6P7Z1Y6_9AMPH|nr:EF-hand calcium-binding domain-containing protein 6 [Microcaecilia unicolor]
MLSFPVNLSDLRPQSRGIVLSERPYSALSRTLSRSSPRSSVKSASTESVRSVPDPSLSFSDIEQIFSQKITESEDDLKKAFQTFDLDHNLTVTKGEFQRVVEIFLLPLTKAQFDSVLAKIPLNSNGTVPYLGFMTRFSRPNINANQLESVRKRWNSGQSNQNMTLSHLEFQLKNKISKNIKNIVRALRLFDYNQKGQIQRHELRQVLENYCFRMKDAEYNKFWNRYSTSKDNTLNYRDLLKNLGINVAVNRRLIPECTQAVNSEAFQEQQKQKSRIPQASTNIFCMEGYVMDEIEMAFKEKICENHQSLTKAFKAFDASHSGFVSLDDIKAIINSFIFPLENETFQELMSRLGFKSTSKIAWEQFLKRCQNPGLLENDQTVSIKSNHRVNLVKEVDFSSDHILQKLHRQIKEAIPTLKKAFFMLDNNRSGKITRKELRRIVDCVMFRINDQQFKELMIILDPGHTGFVNYHHFLELFEEKESPLGHTWLNEAKPDKKEVPVVLAWDTVENILCDKIADKWKFFQKTLQAYDTKGTGIISRNHFRKILHAYHPSLTEEHFKKLCDTCCDNSSDGILYMQFLAYLGMPDLPNDFTGISKHISEESELKEEKRKIDTPYRMKETENQVHKMTKKLTVDEVIGKLKDCLMKQELSFQKSFLSCNKHPYGKISKNDFRKVLEDNEMYMDDYQFNLLTQKLRFTNKGLSYFDFVALFEDSQESGQGITLYRTSNHHVNDTRFHQMTSEECYCQLMEKLRGFKDTYALFHKMDSNSDGFVTMYDLKHLMESFKFIFTQREYLRMLEMLGLQMNSTLSYMEFVDLLHMEEPKEARPWLNSSYRPRQAKQSTEFASDQAHYYLAVKARNRWHDLARTFREFDSDGNGIIQKKDLRTVLYRFAVPITSVEFDKLWTRYDTDKKGYITQQEFLQGLGIELAPGDRVPGRHIAEDTCAGLQEHHIQMQSIEEQQAKAQDTKETAQQIIHKFRDYYQDFSKAFAKMDKNRDGFITVEELHKMLLHYNCHFDKKQFISLLYRLGIKVHDGKVSYFDFLRVIDDGKASKFGERKEQDTLAQMLSPEKALIKLKEAVTCSYDLLYKAFSEFDKDSTGTIMPLEFHHILDNFCSKLTDKQFGYLLTKVKMNDDNAVDWKAFLNNFSFYDTETATDWVKKVDKVTQLKSTPELSMRDIMARIREVVVARFHILAQEFISTDYAKIGATTKDDFREICNKHFMLLTNDQFENLWNTMPINDFGNLRYHEFLKKYSLDAQDSSALHSRRSFSKSASPVSRSSSRPTSSKPRRPKTAPSVLNQSSTREPLQRPRTAVAGSTSILNYEVIENKLKKSVHKIWQHILKACRRKDLEKQGEIAAADFIAVMEKLCCDISKEELDLLIVKYDVKNNGMFSYHEFLKNFVFTPKAQENILLQRMKVHKPRVPMSTGIGSAIFFDAMVRIHPQILHYWRSLRRSFQFLDENGAGYIKVQDFRQILRQHNINLSEEEFFHIMGFYDKDLSSKISYNDSCKYSLIRQWCSKV